MADRMSGVQRLDGTVGERGQVGKRERGSAARRRWKGEREHEEEEERL